jgi:Ca-activated chloride channel family protein
MKGRYSDDYETMKDNIKEAITKVALSHHLVSKYTSLIAIDHGLSEFAPTENMKKTKLAQYAQAQLPQTATPSLFLALLGCFMMIISGGYFLLMRSR